MKRWIRAGIGVTAAFILILQPGQAFAGIGFAPGQMMQLKSEESPGTDVQKEMETSGTRWEEEYTDTDTRRGTISVRGEVFQGFHGTIGLQIRNVAGGWVKSVTLTEGGGYAVNLSLPVGAYGIAEMKAETEGRKFQCQADQTEMEIGEGTIILCRITVAPDSVYRLPYEESTTEATPTTHFGSDERKADAVSEISDEGTGHEESQPGERFHPLWILGILGAGVCLYGFYYVIKQRNEMGG